MPMKFHEVRIVMFDVNTTLTPLVSPGCLHEPMKFLAAGADYNTWYEARSSARHGGLVVRPLPAKVFDHNHFWKNYRGIGGASLHPDYWSLQVPALAALPSMKLTVSTGDSAFTAIVRPVTFLSSIGWSTNLCFTLLGDITPSALTGFMSGLRTGSLMTIDGASASASGVFKTISSRLSAAVFDPACGRVHTVAVPSYAVIGVTSYSGSGVATGGGSKPLTDAGRAMLFGVLQGQSYTPEAWAAARGSYLAREVGTRGTCAITDFQKGTIIFMPVDALRNDLALHDSRQLQCVTSNVARAMMMTLMGAKFHANAAGIDTPTVAGLRTSVQRNIVGMAKAYDNPIFGTWAAKHGAIGKMGAS
jgi:hypothetical protein